MTIKRTLFGTEVSIELTDEEVNEIYDDVRIARLTDDILEKYSGIHGDAPSNEVFDHILQDYKEYIEDAMYCDSCGRVGPISNHLAELCEDNPPAKPKRKYNVHYTMLYSKDVEVQAENMAEASEIASKQLDTADWYPIDGSEEENNIYEM